MDIIDNLVSTPETDRMFYLYFYLPLALIALVTGFFISLYMCRRKGKLWVGVNLFFFPVLAFSFYFIILLTSGLYGEASKFILLFTMILAPPLWLGGILALPFNKKYKKNS